MYGDTYNCFCVFCDCRLRVVGQKAFSAELVSTQICHAQSQPPPPGVASWLSALGEDMAYVIGYQVMVWNLKLK